MDSGYKAAEAALATATKKPKLHVHEVRIRRGHKGGYIAKNHMHDDEGREHATHEYPLADKKAMLAHMDQHMPDDEAAEGESPDNQPDGVK